MARNGKNARRIVHHVAYGPALARLEAALAKNTRSDISEGEKTQLWLLKIFGRAPGTVVIPK